MTDLYAYGTHSDAVRALQQALARRGLYADALDGIFGPDTRLAITAARRRFGLPPGGVDAALLVALGLARKPPATLVGWLRTLAVKQGVDLVLSQLTSQLKGPAAMNFLTGYKTYLIAALMLLTGLAGMLGVDVPSFTGQAPGDLVMQALAFLFLRHELKTGIAKG